VTTAIASEEFIINSRKSISLDTHWRKNITAT